MKFKSNAKYGKPVESGTIYEGRVGKLIVSIHHLYGGEDWFLSCHSLNMSRKPLKSKELVDAINEAKEVMRDAVDSLQKDVNAFCEEDIEISRY